MNQPAQPAPEGAKRPIVEGKHFTLDRKELEYMRAIETYADSLEDRLKALRARCERLEGALCQTIDRCARVELGAPSYYLANDLANVLRAALAQPEDGK